MPRQLKEFRVGDAIPDGAVYVRTVIRKIPGSEYERVGPPRSLLSFLGVTETVYTMVKREQIDIYEVPL